jgi:hypothetical protein
MVSKKLISINSESFVVINRGHKMVSKKLISINSEDAVIDILLIIISADCAHLFELFYRHNLSSQTAKIAF